MIEYNALIRNFNNMAISLNTSNRPTSPWSWIICLLVSLFPLVSFFHMNLMNSLTPTFIKEFHLTTIQVGNVASLYLYTDAFFLIPAGLLLDRYSLRYLIFVALILQATGLLVFSMRPDYANMLLGRLISGLGHAFAILSSFKVITLILPKRQQALAIGLVTTIALLGGLLAQAPFILLIGCCLYIM